jgi:serine protease DegQ
MNDSPADRGGIKLGDVLVAVENKPVVDDASTLNLISSLKPGATATLKLIRDKNPLQIKVTVGKRPKPNPEEK